MGGEGMGFVTVGISKYEAASSGFTKVDITTFSPFWFGTPFTLHESVSGEASGHGYPNPGFGAYLSVDAIKLTNMESQQLPYTMNRRYSCAHAGTGRRFVGGSNAGLRMAARCKPVEAGRRITSAP
jgi:hypothetical protein